MKIKQINKQIIDWYDAKDKGKGNIMAYTVDGKTYVTDGYMIYILTEKDCYFDIKKVKESPMLAELVEGLGSDELVSTGASLNHNNGKQIINLYTYHNDKEATVGVDSKFLKNFENYTLKCIEGETIKPVAVYEYEELVGIVLPIRLDEASVKAVRRV